MKILAVSDLHGNLPVIPPCDLLLIGGDICPDFLNGTRITPDRGEVRQGHWLKNEFAEWLEGVPADRIFGIAGNHDFVFDKTQYLIPRNLKWDYLRDQTRTHKGVKVHGIPWVPQLQSWAFYKPDHELAKKYDLIPDDVDIILSHGPPFGYCDFTSPQFGSAHVGSDAAVEAIQRVHPKAFVCGHIHEARGHKVYRHKEFYTDVYNVSAVNEFYEPYDDPVVEILL